MHPADTGRTGSDLTLHVNGRSRFPRFGNGFNQQSKQRRWALRYWLYQSIDKCSRAGVTSPSPRTLGAPWRFNEDLVHGSPFPIHTDLADLDILPFQHRGELSWGKVNCQWGLKPRVRLQFIRISQRKSIPQEYCRAAGSLKMEQI